jgi:hypothetical protein
MKRLLVVLFVIAIAAVFSGVASAQEKPAPTTVVINTLKAPMGGVKFPHAVHSKMAGTPCTTCHHASKAEKAYAAKVTHEACGDCHTKPAVAPMKTVNPFHVAMAKSGLCIDCHVKQNAAGKKAPTKCGECHKKDNA